MKDINDPITSQKLEEFKTNFEYLLFKVGSQLQDKSMSQLQKFYLGKRDSRSESPLKTTSLSYSFKRISSPTQKYPLELDEEEDPMNINYNRFKTQINDLDYHDYHSHSIRQSHLPYHMDLPIHDISDHESTDDDNETIRAYSPTLTPDDLYSSPNSNLDDIPHPPTRNHTPSNYSSYYSQPNFSQPPSESFESILKENPLLQSATESKSGIKDNISVDDLNSSVKSLHTVHDAKTAGYAIIFTLISFIGIHIIPIVELFPILLRSRMGSIVSSLVLFALSICIGYQVSISRVSYIRFYRQLKTHRTFLSCRSLVVLLISLYLTSYTTPFIFRWSIIKPFESQ
ncbi:hypothetical protein HDV02_003832 [Globomyces sp. JEL0801]|nr:hypothetical protein HDV02_003832 [Globomyces sp. JEL0801]